MRRPKSVGRYAYVMLKDPCPMHDDNPVYMANDKLPGHEVFILMIKNDAFGCEIYRTNFSDDIADWKNISTFGSIMSDLF